MIALATVQLSTLFAASVLPWLSTKGQHIVDDKGKKITLNGINLGGWLVEEIWMLPIQAEAKKGSSQSKIQDHHSLWSIIERRFGKVTMEQIRKRFRERWIMDRDFSRIKAMGFNTVRLPFLYDLVNEKEGLFFWLDCAVAMAKKHGLYVILDMHGTPGRQSKEHHTGKQAENQLFVKDRHVKETAKIWATIASHFKDCPTVAGYDLINEPMGAPNSKKLFRVYDAIYKAIRQKDKRHIIIMQDGFKGVHRVPSPKDHGWKNVVLSTHRYTHDAISAKDHLKNLTTHLQKVGLYREKRNAPFYLGEFNVAPHGTHKTVKQILTTLKEQKLSYSFWTYKMGKSHPGLAKWGLFYLTKEHKKIDPYKDSLDQILKKIEHLKTEYFHENKELINSFSK